jgi:hypothetical protein
MLSASFPATPNRGNYLQRRTEFLFKKTEIGFGRIVDD